MNRIRVMPRTAAVLVAILCFLMMSWCGGVGSAFNGLADPESIGMDPSVTSGSGVIAISVRWWPSWIFLGVLKGVATTPVGFLIWTPWRVGIH